MSANNQQVGGNHYSAKAVQPWDYITSNNLGYLEGNVVKYVSRWKEKNGVEDLYKAKHYLEKLIELQKPVLHSAPVPPLAPQSEADSLREEIEMLRSHINNGIEKTCGFFCALPECPRAQQKSDSF